MKQPRSRRASEILLALVIIARATGYLFSKLGMTGLGMFNLLALRFLLAFVLLGAVFAPRLCRIDKRTLRAGIVMGGLYFLVMTAELSGLRRTASSTVSFLENTAIVIVPLLQAVLLRRFPRWKAVICALLCLIGVGFLTIGSGMAFGAGEMFCMLAAFLYACAILTTDRLTHGNIDALASGIVQVGIIGALSLTASLLFEAPRLPSGMLEWTGIVMLAVVCSGFGFTLQPVAQSGTTAERAGMFCALNPMVATILGIVFLHEAFTIQSAVGGGVDVGHDGGVRVPLLGLADLLGGAHGGHGALGLGLGQEHLLGRGEDLRGLPHEGDTAENDDVCIRSGGLLRQSEGVPDIVRYVLHLGGGVVVGQDDRVLLLLQSENAFFYGLHGNGYRGPA